MQVRTATKLGSVHDDANAGSQGRRGTIEPQHNQKQNDAWIEEQKANFEHTYLKPLKMKKLNDSGPKPQAKTIKGGRLVKLPLVVRNKVPDLAKANMDNTLTNKSNYNMVGP